MSKFCLGLFSILLIGLLVVGCSEKPADPVSSADFSQLANFILPPGATLESAIFYIYVVDVSGENIEVKRITDAWAEPTVTWNSFGGAYAPDVYGSFIANSKDWHSVDLTSLVQEWIDGTYENYGFLIDHELISNLRSTYYSREVSYSAPYMEICYSVGSETSYDTILAIADASIFEILPDNNYGLLQFLYTGWTSSGDFEKQAMLMFDFTPTSQDDGCTHTIGYWKNHAGCGPQDDKVTPLLPIWLGTPGGPESIEVTTAGMAKKILSQRYYCHPSNGITKLYAQMLAAKLNVANGANPEALGTLFERADAFLAKHDCGDWKKLRNKKKIRILRWKCRFDRYNNGKIGPGHCDD